MEYIRKWKYILTVITISAGLMISVVGCGGGSADDAATEENTGTTSGESTGTESSPISNVEGGNTLTVTVNPVGGGTVSPNKGSYAPGTVIKLTATAATFYRGGTIAPQLVGIFDPVNLFAMIAPELKYFYTNDFVFTFQARYIWPMKTPMNDPWFIGRFGRRAEAALKLTYQF